MIYGFGLGADGNVGYWMAVKLHYLGAAGERMKVAVEIPSTDRTESFKKDFLGFKAEVTPGTILQLKDTYTMGILNTAREYCTDLILLDDPALLSDEMAAWSGFQRHSREGKDNPCLPELHRIYAEKEEFMAKKLKEKTTPEDLVVVGVGYLHLDRVMNLLGRPFEAEMPSRFDIDTIGNMILEYRDVQ